MCYNVFIYQGPRGRRRKVKRAPSEVGSDDEIEPEPEPESEPAPSEPEKKTRMACTYGKKCYRSFFLISVLNIYFIYS